MDIYEELGVKTFINAYYPLTRCGGALMPEPVMEAMVQASKANVMLSELQSKVGRAIARLTNNDAAYVSCGAAAGITLATATCIAGRDPQLAARLPDTRGMKNEVIMHTADRGYKADVSAACAGASIVYIGDENSTTEDQLIGACTANTAALLFVDIQRRNKLDLAKFISIGKSRRIPVIVDAAQSVPPRENLWNFTTAYGADAVIVSGGKGLRGPQTSGLVLGGREMIAGCAFHGVPNTRIGRGMKVGKEEMVAIYVALKLFLQSDPDEGRATAEDRCDAIISCISRLEGVHTRRISPSHCLIAFDSKYAPVNYTAIADELMECVPAVFVGHSDAGILVNTAYLRQGQENEVASGLEAVFRRFCAAKPNRTSAFNLLL